MKSEKLSSIYIILIIWQYFFSDNQLLRFNPYIFWPVLAGISLLTSEYKFFGRQGNYTILVLTGLITCIFSSLIFSYNSYENILILIEIILYLIAIRLIINRNIDFNLIINSLLFFTSIHAFLLFLQFFYPNIFYPIVSLTSGSFITEVITDAQDGQYMGLTGQTSTISAHLIVGIIVSLYKTTSVNGNKYFILTFLFSIGILLTNRRGAFLISILLILLFFLLDNRKKLSKLAIILVILIVVFTIGLENIPGLSSLVDKFNYYANSDDATSGRLELWDICINAFINNKFLGIGFNNMLYYIDDVSAHNSYLQKLAELGIIGSFFFFLPFIYGLIETIRIFRTTKLDINKNHLLLMLFLFQVYFFSISLFEGFFETPCFYVLIFLIQYLSLNIDRNQVPRFDSK